VVVVVRVYHTDNHADLLQDIPLEAKVAVRV
jgi:hypothetical protein